MCFKVLQQCSTFQCDVDVLLQCSTFQCASMCLRFSNAVHFNVRPCASAAQYISNCCEVIQQCSTFQCAVKCLSSAAHFNVLWSASAVQHISMRCKKLQQCSINQCDVKCFGRAAYSNVLPCTSAVQHMKICFQQLLCYGAEWGAKIMSGVILYFKITHFGSPAAYLFFLTLIYPWPTTYIFFLVWKKNYDTRKKLILCCRNPCFEVCGQFSTTFIIFH